MLHRRRTHRYDLQAATCPRLPVPPLPMPGCALVVDAGFSFTHAVPIFDWRVLGAGVRRVDLGGKAMTNWMKEQVSYRCAGAGGGGCRPQPEKLRYHCLACGLPALFARMRGCCCCCRPTHCPGPTCWPTGPIYSVARSVCTACRRSINLMDEFLLIEHIKDQLCFVSQDAIADLAASRGRNSKYKWVTPGGRGQVGMAGKLRQQQRLAALTVENSGMQHGQIIAVQDLGRSTSPLQNRVEYVLPDGINDTWGHVFGERPEEQSASGSEQQQQQGGGGSAAAGGGPGGAKAPKQTLLVVNNERFMTPEVRN